LVGGADNAQQYQPGTTFVRRSVKPIERVTITNLTITEHGSGCIANLDRRFLRGRLPGRLSG
jgi:hypothetical protein